MSTPNPIIEKLRKLVHHEQSARSIGSIHEAEAFAGKIQELLNQHTLSMSDVDFADREESEPIGFSEYSGPEGYQGGPGKKRHYWTLHLACAIGDANECEIVSGHGNRFAFVGRTSNRELCVIMFKYMFTLAQDVCDKCADEDKDLQYALFDNDRGHVFQSWQAPEKASAFRHWMKDYKKSFRVGFADAIAKRLNKATEDKNKQAAKSGAIVHIEKDAAAIEVYLKGKTTGGTVTHRAGANEYGYSRGAEAGSSIALTPHTFAPKSSGRVVGLLGG